jgi:hypothetical protein
MPTFRVVDGAIKSLVLTYSLILSREIIYERRLPTLDAGSILVPSTPV